MRRFIIGPPYPTGREFRDWTEPGMREDFDARFQAAGGDHFDRDTWVTGRAQEEIAANLNDLAELDARHGRVLDDEGRAA